MSKFKSDDDDVPIATPSESFYSAFSSSPKSFCQVCLSRMRL